jgi:hypothetical protein
MNITIYGWSTKSCLGLKACRTLLRATHKSLAILVAL